MCIAVPAQVVSTAPGRALTQGRGGRRVVDTALVGPVQPGEWLLVFLDSARSVIDADRAAEVNAVLDLVESAMDGIAGDGADPCFTLPSAMPAEQLAALAGTTAGETR